MNTAHLIDKDSAVSNETRMEQLQTVLYRYCLSITCSPWDAEDLAQETWLKAFATSKLTSHNNHEALLLRIAKNTWIDQSRRKNVLNRILEREHMKVAAVDSNPIEAEKIFQVILKHQSPLQRAVFLLREVFGYSIKETGEILEMTEGAVKAAHHRARQTIGAIKHDLLEDALPLPQNEEMKAVLQALLNAYLSGDVARVVRLALADQISEDVATAFAQNKRLAITNAKYRGAPYSTIQMAA